jgi:hypothetical protein
MAVVLLPVAAPTLAAGTVCCMETATDTTSTADMFVSAIAAKTESGDSHFWVVDGKVNTVRLRELLEEHLGDDVGWVAELDVVIHPVGGGTSDPESGAGVVTDALYAELDALRDD